jgi:hypothetical protein
MKKFIISIVCCLLIFGGYYLFKNKNRLYAKWKHKGDDQYGYVWSEDKGYEPISPPAKDTAATDDVKDLIKTVKQLKDLTEKLESMNNQHVDSIYSLHVVIDSLNNVIASKPKLKIQSTPFENSTPVHADVVTEKKSKKSKTLKNEKNLPIARSNDALKLKEFFTERYDNR